MAADFSGRTVFVTGASSDIGLALCRLLLASGVARIVAHHRTQRAELDELADGHSAMVPLQLDFADTASLARMIEKDDQNLISGADILVNLAAAVPAVSFETFCDEDIMDCLRVNLLPGLMLMQAMGPAMAARGWGRIAHASSIGVKFGGGRDSFAYSLSKHCQEFIPQACRSWAKQNVLTNVVRIGVTNTRIHNNHSDKQMAERESLIPMNRMAQPEEIAAYLHWLVSSANTYVTGEVLAVAGGE